MCFYKQIGVAAMGNPLSSVTASILISLFSPPPPSSPEAMRLTNLCSGQDSVLGLTFHLDGIWVKYKQMCVSCGLWGGTLTSSKNGLGESQGSCGQCFIPEVDMFSIGIIESK